MITAFRCGNRVPLIGTTRPTDGSVSSCRALPMRTSGQPGFATLHEREFGVNAPVWQGARAADSLISGNMSPGATWVNPGHVGMAALRQARDVFLSTQYGSSTAPIRASECSRISFISVYEYSYSFVEYQVPRMFPKSGLGGASCFDGSCLWSTGMRRRILEHPSPGTAGSPASHDAALSPGWFPPPSRSSHPFGVPGESGESGDIQSCLHLRAH